MINHGNHPEKFHKKIALKMVVSRLVFKKIDVLKRGQNKIKYNNTSRLKGQTGTKLVMSSPN